MVISTIQIRQIIRIAHIKIYKTVAGYMWRCNNGVPEMSRELSELRYTLKSRSCGQPATFIFDNLLRPAFKYTNAGLLSTVRDEILLLETLTWVEGAKSL